MNVHPHDGIRQHEQCYGAFMKAIGKLPSDSPLPFSAGSKRYMKAYFKYAHAPLEDAGCDAWWVDWQQDCIVPFVRGFDKLRHIPWLNHCYYHHLEQKGHRGLSFSRWGGYGDQKYPIHFSGDTTATWEVLAFEIAFTLISGNSGCFFWTHDMGGFCGERNEELYARWLQFGALTAALRLHSAGDDLDRRPWKWAQPFQASLKGSFRLRSRLMPYLYNAMRNACRDSVPMLRPLYFDYPEAEDAYTNYQEFQVGDHLLAAPITFPGNGNNCLSFQKLRVLDGEWRSLYSGCRYCAGWHAIPSAIDEMPLLVRTGIALPFGSAEKKHLADVDDALTLLFFPPAADCEYSYVLYEDDGVSMDYLQGAYYETTIRTSASSHHVSVCIIPPQNGWYSKKKTRLFSLQCRCIRHVKSANINGAPVPFCLDECTHTLTIGPVAVVKSAFFNIDYDVVDDAILQQELIERYSYEGELSSNDRQLLNGHGVLKFRNPLTGALSMMIWPPKNTITLQ